MTPRSPADPLGRLRDFSARFGLDEPSLEKLALVVEAVLRDPHAPTAVRGPRQVLDDHLADSLVALELESMLTATSFADIGAGAGFPSLPLAAALPAISARAVESGARKCAFIASAAALAGIENLEVVCARAEEWPEGVEANDVVTARALAPLPVVAEWAAPLLRVGGTLIAWRGRREAAEEAAAAQAAAELGLAVGEVVPVKPYPAATDRHLHLFHKLEATPPRFPRRPGVARKRPLGG